MSEWRFYEFNNSGKGDIRKEDGSIVAAWVSKEDASTILSLRSSLADAERGRCQSCRAG